jgi:hypothetical protein
MISDLVELEPLLSQYDPGKILVGPLLNLSISSNFRYFYIAGNGDKIYESIGLGFEAEADAERQRLDIIEKLKSRFREVAILGSHLEMAQAVHTVWPNEETASVLALAALETKAHPTTVASQDGTVHDDSQACTNGSGPELTNAVAGEPVTHIEDLASVLMSRDPGEPPPLFWAPAMSAPAKLPDATASWPLNVDHTATPPERPSGFNPDTIAAAVLGLKASMGSIPEPPIESSRRSGSRLFWFCVGGSIAALVAGIFVISSARRVADESMPSPVLTPLLSANGADDPALASDAATGPISSIQSTKADDRAPQSAPRPVTSPPSQSPQMAGAAGATGSTSSGPIAKANEPAPQTEPASVAPPKAPSQSPQVASAQVEPAIAPGAIGKADETAPQAERTPVTTPPPPLQSPQTASAKADQPTAQAEAVPVSPPSPSPKMAKAQPETAPVPGSQSPSATRLNADVIDIFVSRAQVFLKSGDFAAARVLLRRAADAGSASASLMLGETFDPVVIHEIGALGIEPDVAQAREWYRKAADLGSDLATQRLGRLAQTR